MILAAFLSPTLGGYCPFMSAVTVPYSHHGEETKQSQKAGQNSEIQGASARRAADRAGAGGTAQSRDQPRRSGSRIDNGHALGEARFVFLPSPHAHRAWRGPRPAKLALQVGGGGSHRGTAAWATPLPHPPHPWRWDSETAMRTGEEIL